MRGGGLRTPPTNGHLHGCPEGPWRGSPRTPHCQQQGGLALALAHPSWAQLCGQRFLAGAGTFLFPQPPRLIRRDPAVRGRWPSGSPDSMEPRSPGAEVLAVPRGPGAAGEQVREHRGASSRVSSSRA